MLLFSRFCTTVKQLLLRAIHWITASTFRFVFCLTIGVIIIAGGSTLAYISSISPAPQAETSAESAKTTPKQQQDTSSSVPQQQSENTDETSTQQSPAKSNAAKPSSAQSKATLIIDKSTVFIKAGQSATITVRSSDGRAINNPLMTQNIGVQLNTGFGGARPTWTVTLTAMQNVSKPGTYTLKLGAQDASAAFLYGSLTVTIGSVADFTMYASLYSSDPANPVKYYQVYVTPSGGFTGVVEIIGAVSGAPCGVTSGAVANSPFDLYCTVPSAAPHGTITITVRAMYEPITRTTTVSY